MKLSKNEKENLYFYSNLSPSLMENCLPSQFRSTLLAKTLEPLSLHVFYRAEKAKFPFGNVAHFCTRKKWENEIICIHNTISLDYFSGYDRRLPGFPRYSVLGTDDSGEFSLQITNASLADDAIFECQVGPSISNRPIRASARVNVLRKFLDILPFLRIIFLP